jgi:hypothetical protein
MKHIYDNIKSTNMMIMAIMLFGGQNESAACG